MRLIDKIFHLGEDLFLYAQKSHKGVSLVLKDSNDQEYLQLTEPLVSCFPGFCGISNHPVNLPFIDMFKELDILGEPEHTPLYYGDYQVDFYAFLKMDMI